MVHENKARCDNNWFYILCMQYLSWPDDTIFSPYMVYPASTTAFCPVTDFDVTYSLTWAATSSTVANRCNAFRLLVSSSLSAGKERPQSCVLLEELWGDGMGCAGRNGLP